MAEDVIKPEGDTSQIIAYRSEGGNSDDYSMGEMEKVKGSDGQSEFSHDTNTEIMAMFSPENKNMKPTVPVIYEEEEEETLADESTPIKHKEEAKPVVEEKKDVMEEFKIIQQEKK
jgi:hypothetical protein